MSMGACICEIGERQTLHIRFGVCQFLQELADHVKRSEIDAGFYPSGPVLRVIPLTR